jgi:hypothetical protein
MAQQEASESADPGRERRVHPRTAVTVPAALTLVGYTAEGELESIGAGGVRFCTSDANVRVEPGNFIAIRFDGAREGKPVTIERPVRVRWVSPVDGAGLRRFGLEFDEKLDLGGLSL